MSIKKKVFLCLAVMLVVPIAVITVLSLCMLELFTFLYPDKIFSALEGLNFSDPLLLKWILVWATVSFLVVLGTAVLVTLYISRSILRPMQEVTCAIEHIKNGDLDYEFTGSEDAEFQALCASLEELRLRLQKNVRQNLHHEQEQRMLLANFSHDIKTPITSIRGYVEGILEGIADTPAMLERYLQTIQQKTNAIEVMVDNLSLYSKLEMKKIPYHMERRDIFAFLKESLSEFELDAQKGEVALSCKLPEDPCTVCFDAEKLRRVCGNLITNAIKYKKAGQGKLEISGEKTAHGVVLSFSDSGVGISKAEQKKVFEGFYRGDPSRNNKIAGNGLGLSICRQIIEDHGGKIWIHSEEGIGTEVFVLLPFAKRVRDTEEKE